jgi:hypothetical protein
MSGADDAGFETTVAWTAIERHWTVFASCGTPIGEVYTILGDQRRDIFDGLEITRHASGGILHHHVDQPRYVDAELVSSIQPGAVRLVLNLDQAAMLPPSRR